MVLETRALATFLASLALVAMSMGTELMAAEMGVWAAMIIGRRVMRTTQIVRLI